MDKYPMLLSPYVSETIWGGRRLIEEYNVKTEKSNAAEGWMLSCLKNGYSTVLNGAFQGRPLYEVLDANRSWMGSRCERFAEFPILIKFIDAMDDLSVQVHPTKEYCDKTGRGRSKTECWYIIDCDDDAHLILGFKEKITREEFEKSIKDGTLTDYVDKVKVKPGDFFFIESGTLHAICRGVLLAEVQESSDTTYRIFDYNRMGKDGKPRELHIMDALEVTRLEKYSQPDFSSFGTDDGLLAECDLFTVRHKTVSGNSNGFAGSESFVSLLVLDGSGLIECCSDNLALRKGDSLFIPAGSGSYSLKGNLDLIETEI